ncbi:CamS family sex pheromone protein [Metabacillus sediminilitoris]|uniref:CamS family sex pheromone protein n=1 Tax=Metabacillus sediminilitoris TaxID=2567941 RepID=A0A4V3WEX6_9BACI|nr:CamS family sex pheromone protein [Metabacillus sediminilitoris]QGQ44151.1 CamS family sex pheromone protein [Metabacillus sediminilitoris]THF78115.1 CamS family sex pheromone protein [Metabacillus sediminilitoris]
MKKKLFMVLASILVLTACAPNFGEQEEIVQETEDDSKEQAIIPKYNISDSYYKMILPFKPGEARGLVSEQLNTRLDIDEFETGLMRVAQDTFSPDNYLYQEGQYLSGDVINGWLKRRLVGEKLKSAQEEAPKKDKNNIGADEKYVEVGLNPALPEGNDLEKLHSENPIYLAHMLEHNYLIRKDDTVELGGVVIGLAMNSVYYYKQQDGYAREKKISRSELLAKGKEISETVINRIRNTKGLEKVPVVIAIYEQEEKSSIVPGNFIAKTVVKESSNSIGKWEGIDEEYYFFPSDKATSDYRDDAQMFNRFKTDIEEFFPNYVGVIGKAFYKNAELNYLDIEIPMQFYSKSEVVAFTQFVTGKVMEYFPAYISLEVNISSNNGQEALIIKKPDQEEPTVHVYK